MPRADLLLLGAAMMVLAGCSETTWRRSSQQHVVIDGREITLSWTRLQADEVEVVAWERPIWTGVAAKGTLRLDRMIAARAAETVAGERCGDRFVAAPTLGTYAEGHHAFRYRCLP
jgi:hypothetical protein